MTDNKKELKKASLDRKLEIVKCITYNVQLNKGNKEVSALINFESEANLISQGYTAVLPLEILDTSWDLTTINKKQISTRRMIIAGFEINNSTGRTWWFEETFSIADILKPVDLGMLFLKLANPYVSWMSHTMHLRQ